MLFAANLSMLWAELPLAERFERAARAGFRAVELWWPGTAAARALPELTETWSLQLALLNFDAGDMAAGERGIAGDPARSEYLRAHVPDALAIAAACGCSRLNLLVGLRQERYSEAEQMACAPFLERAITLVNPRYLLLVGGALLIYLEFNTPGTIVPGALGTLLVLLGFQ